MAIALQSERELDHDLQEYVNRLDKNPNGNLSERLTLAEIAQKYPDQWVGLTDVEWGNESKTSIISAKVGFVGRTLEELTMLQTLDITYAWYTTPDEM